MSEKQSKTRIEIELMDMEVSGSFKDPLTDTKQKIVLPLTKEQEALLRARLRGIGESEDERGHSDMLLQISLLLLIKDFEGNDYGVAYGDCVHVPTTCKAAIEVLDGKSTAEDAAMALST